jgi:hypothetical protein
MLVRACPARLVGGTDKDGRTGLLVSRGRTSTSFWAVAALAQQLNVRPTRWSGTACMKGVLCGLVCFRPRPRPFSRGSSGSFRRRLTGLQWFSRYSG